MLSLWIRWIAFIFVLLVFATGSWLCLFRTRQFQRWVVELRRDHKYMASEDHLKSDSYLWELRFTGLMSGLAALFMVYLLIKLLIAAAVSN